MSVIRQRYIPGLVLALAEKTSVSELARVLATSKNEKIAAYVCKNNTCNLPIHNPDELSALFDGRI